MICDKRKYHYKINFSDDPAQYDVVLTKELELSRKQPNDEMFFRTESSEWTLLKWQNPGVYQRLFADIMDPEAVDYDIFALVHYHSNGINYTHPEYAGYVSLDGIKLDEHLGKISFKPKPYDNYTWFDQWKDIKLDWRFFTAASGILPLVRFSDPVNPGYDAHFYNSVPIISFIQNILWACGQTSWTVQSDYFTNATNPVTGTTNRMKGIYVNEAINGKIYTDNPTGEYDLTHTYSIDEIRWYWGIFYISLQNGNLNHTPSTSPTWWAVYDPITEETTVQFTAGEVFDMLKKIKCYWYISGGDLVIEHLKYFENGYSYTPAAGTIIDLTNQSNYPLKYQILRDLSNTDRIPFEMNLEEVPAKETYKYSQSSFDPVAVTYTSHLASKTKTEEVSITRFLGELQNFLYPETYDNVSDDTLILLCVDPTPTAATYLKNSYNANVRVKTYTAGVASWVTRNLTNGNMFLQNLIPAFCTHGRFLLNGTIDEVTTVFASKKRYMIQNIKYPRLEIESTYTQLPVKIKTNKGNMTIEEIKIICDTGWIEAKVSNQI